VRNWRAVVDQVARSLVVLAPVHKHTELVDTDFTVLRRIEGWVDVVHFEIVLLVSHSATVTSCFPVCV